MLGNIKLGIPVVSVKGFSVRQRRDCSSEKQAAMVRNVMGASSRSSGTVPDAPEANSQQEHAAVIRRRGNTLPELLCPKRKNGFYSFSS